MILYDNTMWGSSHNNRKGNVVDKLFQIIYPPYRFQTAQYGELRIVTQLYEIQKGFQYV